MRLFFPAFLLLPVLLSGQTADSVTNQKLLEELQNLRAVLTRLVGAMEGGQKAQLALAALQLEQSRAAALEAQKQQLLAKEGQMDEALRQAAERMDAEKSGLVQMVPAAAGELREHHAAAARQRDEVRSARQNIEQALSELHTRMAATEKILQELLR